MKNNNEECELMLEAFNSAHHVLYRAERVEVGVFQVEFLDKGDIYLRLTNNFVRIKKMSFGEKNTFFNEFWVF